MVQNGGTYYYEIQVVFYGIIGLGAWGLVDQSWVNQFFAMNFTLIYTTELDYVDSTLDSLQILVVLFDGIGQGQFLHLHGEAPNSSCFL
jgi:hypothetical protein